LGDLLLLRLHLLLLRLHLLLLRLDLFLLRRHLLLLLLDERLLFFGRLDEQRGKAAVIDALRVLAVLVPGDDLGDDRPDFFGDYSDFVFAVGLQFIGDATELLDLP
jgi:hypothetical protein